MWLLAPALAMAGLRADVRDATRRAPDLALVCSSAKDAWTRMARLSAAMDEEPEAGRMEALLAGKAAAELFDEESRLTMSFWREAGAAEVAFDSTRTARQVADAIAGLDLAGTTTVRPDADGWIVRDGAGSESRVTVEAGRALIRDGTPPRDPDHIVPVQLLEAMPERPGCVAVLHLPEGELGTLDLAVHVSFVHAEPATFALAGRSIDVLEGVLLDPGRPAEVRTPTAPEGVVVLGVGLDGIDFSKFLEGRALRKARRAQSALPVCAGTTVGVFAGGAMPVVALSMPLPERMSARRVARRARKVARGLGLEVERTDATHFLSRDGQVEVMASAQRGRLLLATDAGVLRGMEAAEGEAWVRPEVADLAARYPLVVSSLLVPSPGDGPPVRLDTPLTFAVGLQPGLLSGQVVIPLTIEELGELAAEPAAPGELPPDSAFPTPPDSAFPTPPDE